VRSRPQRRRQVAVTPVTKLQMELTNLRRKLRTALRAYGARLEIDLAESIAIVAEFKPVESLPRQRFHEIRELTNLVRNCKLKPEKGRRKDLRKIDSLIREIHSMTHPGALDLER
jgi:hypothetical protein